ncbi:MAG: site-specific DNA-methyltransferase, partial [Hydrogenothermaceae bacterium]|nr:site-specific DNA-methyltransferase [Hydrogenothermaceae bacterium]
PQEMVIDIPETFNYLLGLKVKKVKVRYNNTIEGRKYIFILGERDRKNIVIIWREYDEKWKDEDYKKDKEFIRKELEGDWYPHIVYINGQTVLTNQHYEIKHIEPEFKKLIW